MTVTISNLFNEKLATWIENTYNSCEGVYHPSLAYKTMQDMECIIDSGTAEYAHKALLKYMRTIQYNACKN